jgi:hypothetical protein
MFSDQVASGEIMHVLKEYAPPFWPMESVTFVTFKLPCWLQSTCRLRIGGDRMNTYSVSNC